MKKLLEAINRGILKCLNESNINLLADLDGDELGDTMYIKHKNINTNSKKNIIVSLLKNIIYKFNDITFNGDYNSTTIENVKSTINNPDNFCEYAGIITANDTDHLIELIEIGLELFGDDGNFNWIDTSKITDMSGLFNENTTFNGHIELWDVSNVTDMSEMFYGSSFNLSIGDWDVSCVTTMGFMFCEAYAFNLPINNWDVNSVSDMRGMFSGASKFNLSISSWDVSNVNDMSYMFSYARSFNQPLHNWSISKSSNTARMFIECPIENEYKPTGIHE